MKEKKRVVIFVAFFLMVFSVIVFAAPGDLDSTFGTEGVATYNGPTNHDDSLNGVALQRDGKIVVVGGRYNNLDPDVLVLRYNPDGTLDDTFGTEGVVNYNGQATGNVYAYGVAIQNDGKIIVVGTNHNDILALRYNPDGTLDDTFGTGGVVIYNGPGNQYDNAYGVAIQRDGKIVVVGYSYSSSIPYVLVLRYNTDGTLDATFGTGGVVTYNGPVDRYNTGLDVAIQNDGKIVVVGQSYIAGGVISDALILRYTKNGIPDATFGTGGVVTYNGPAIPSWNAAYGIAIQSDGKIVVVGYSDDDALILRYTKKGILDSTFGTGGVITYNGPANQDDLANGVAIQRDGKIVVVGLSYNGATSLDVLILRYVKNGVLDSTFGAEGVVTYNGPAYGAEYGNGVAIQRDGKIVAVGKSWNGVNFDGLVIRLLGK